MKKLSLLFALLTVVSALSISINAQNLPKRVRTIVTTDGEVDDQDTFARLLLYSNEFNIVGLVYSSSQWHYKGDGKGTKMTSEIPMTAKLYGERSDLRWTGTEWMDEFIDKYAQVYPNLAKNAKGYPTAAYLKSLVRIGNIDFEGEMSYDTPGSDFIKAVLMDDDTSPVYLQVWGGTNTIARALKSIEDTYKDKPEWNEIHDRVSKKAVIYAVLDQDATYKKYIEPNWSQIRVLYNSNQFWSFAYPWPRVVPAEMQPYLSGPWMDKNIRNHGALLDHYYLWGDGRQIKGDWDHTQGDLAATKKAGHQQYDFISEGDTPAFLFLTDVGLRNKEDASYGGWGGRMVATKANPYRWEDGKEATDYNFFSKKPDAAFAQTRWVDVIQNDMAARAEWCIKDYKHANHAPIVKLKHANNMEAKPGAEVQLSGSAKDTDGNTVTYKWWQYKDVGTYNGEVTIQAPTDQKTKFTVPADAKPGDTIHVILEVKDSGTPQLTRYQRVIVTVK